MRIGIDIDDVVSRTGQIFYKKINERFGLNIEFTKVPSYNYVDQEVEKHGFSLKEFYDFINEMQTMSPYHDELIPRRDFKKTISALHKMGHIIYLISNRHIMILPYTTVWFKKMGILKYVSGILHNTYTEKPYSEFKIRESKRLKIEVFLEDALDYALPISKQDIEVILFDRPWNQAAELPKNVHRINDWKEAMELLLKLEKLKLGAKT